MLILQVMLLKAKLCQINNLQMNNSNQLLENLKNVISTLVITRGCRLSNI